MAKTSFRTIGAPLPSRVIDERDKEATKSVTKRTLPDLLYRIPIKPRLLSVTVPAFTPPYHPVMTSKWSCLMATVTIRVAPHLTNEIIDQLQDDTLSLRNCSMVAKSWRDRALKWLFEAVVVQVTARDPWSYLRWLGNPTPGLHSATIHARGLRLVQYPSFKWITPRMLYPMLPAFSAFRTVTRLSLHSLSVHLFNETDIQAIFGHFFPTVKELNLEEPCAVAGSLHKFICHFAVLDHLTISDPEWELGSESLDEVETIPPLRGTLHLRGLYADSEEFLDLLARTPAAFQDILFVGCQLPSEPTNRLLRHLSRSLKSFSASTWFNGDRIPSVDLSPCALVEEVGFFVAMVPAEKLPLQAIRKALGSVSSRRVRAITLDLSTTDVENASSEEFLRNFGILDFNLQRIALTQRKGRQIAVKLSANDPYILGSCLPRFKNHGKLVLGTRSRGAHGMGDVEWFDSE